MEEAGEEEEVTGCRGNMGKKEIWEPDAPDDANKKKFREGI